MRGQDGLGFGKTVTCLWRGGASHSFMVENELFSVCVYV